MKCTRCMTVKIQGNSSLCEFRGLGSACGTCFSTGSTRCSFELGPEEVGIMVNELFKPWQSLTLSCWFILSCLYFFFILLTRFCRRSDPFNRSDRSGFVEAPTPAPYRRRARIVAHSEHPRTSFGLRQYLRVRERRADFLSVQPSFALGVAR